MPKAIVNARQCAPAMMDEVVESLDSALSKVVSNKGAPGPDGVTVQALREAVRQVFEPTFHPSSHGFRPGRSCHTAVAEAAQHLQDGHEWW